MVWVTDVLLPFQKVLPVCYFPPDGDAIRILGPWNGETQLKPSPVELGGRFFRGVTYEIEVGPFWHRQSPRKGRCSVAVSSNRKTKGMIDFF
eukprot:2743960-Prymnesium_polylepis.1